MKFALIFILLFSATSFNAFSQDDVEETILTPGETVELISGQIIDFGYSVINDMLQLQQIGNNNQITAIQQLNGNTQFILTANQEGTGNIGYINQSGNGHESSLVQNGNTNVANLWSVGSQTQNFVQQEGIGNQVNSFIENYNSQSRTATSIQIGDGNKLNLQLPDNNSENSLIGIMVLQTGAGNSADLYLDHFEAPYLKVEQTGGAAISITHSAFNFPTK
jgi:hypothetical protein